MTLVRKLIIVSANGGDFLRDFLEKTQNFRASRFKGLNQKGLPVCGHHFFVILGDQISPTTSPPGIKCFNGGACEPSSDPIWALMTLFLQKSGRCGW